MKYLCNFLFQELKQRKLDAINHVPQEPSHDSDGICRILVRLPSGQKLERRFHRTIHTLKVKSLLSYLNKDLLNSLLISRICTISSYLIRIPLINLKWPRLSRRGRSNGIQVQIFTQLQLKSVWVHLKPYLSQIQMLRIIKFG